MNDKGRLKRMLQCKTCLCGPCEQWGVENFNELEALVHRLALGVQKQKSFLERINRLRSYLAHDFRGACSFSSPCATRCIA